MTWDAFDRNSHLCLDGRIVRLSTHPVAAGGYADVWGGSLEDRKVAIKVMRLFSSTGKFIEQTKLIRRLWREYKAWSDLSHPNVLECLGFSYDFSPDIYVFPSLISPWMSNGTAMFYLENYPDTDRSQLLVGVAEGLLYLHTREPAIVHGDLRAGNILISDFGVACLSDFGLSRVLDEVRGATTSTDIAGSLRWMSPELFQSDRGVTVYSDIWAYGMTVLEILSGKRPYAEVKNDIFVLGDIKEGCLPSRPQSPEILQDLNDQMWFTCQRCWSLQPERRPSMKEVKSMILASGIQPYSTQTAELGHTVSSIDSKQDTLLSDPTITQALQSYRTSQQRSSSPDSILAQYGDTTNRESNISRDDVTHPFGRGQDSRISPSRASRSSGLFDELVQSGSASSPIGSSPATSPISPREEYHNTYLAHESNVSHDDTMYDPMAFFDLYDGNDNDTIDNRQPSLSPVNTVFELQLEADVQAAHQAHSEHMHSRSTLSQDSVGPVPGTSDNRAGPWLRESDLPRCAIRVVRSNYSNEVGKDKISFVLQVVPFGFMDTKISWKVEKPYSGILDLDAHVRTNLSEDHEAKLGHLPQIKLFTDNAPAKVDLRKAILQEFLQRVVQAPLKNRLYLCKFFSTDVIHETNALVNKAGYKEGYLVKRGKNFGGWKTRYFVLQSATLEYYESRGGVLLGWITLRDAQIGRQQESLTPDTSDAIDNNVYRHGLFILEGGVTSQPSRHVLCADNDEERDSWVDKLLRYVSGSYEGTAPTTNYPDVVSRQGGESSHVGTAGSLPEASIRGENALAANVSSFPDLEGRKDRNRKTKPRRFWNFTSEKKRPAFERTGFVVPIADTPSVTQINNLPAIVFRCIQYLEATKADQEEGIYYVSGSSAVITALIERFNTEGDIDLLASNEMWDPHAITGLLKRFLREMPTSILTREMHLKLLAVVAVSQPQQRVDELARLIWQLPPPNYHLLRALAAHLILVVKSAEVNKMTMKNIVLCLSPVLRIRTPLFTLMLGEFHRVFNFRMSDEDESRG